MKKLIITSALIISALFTYAESGEKKVTKVKSAYESISFIEDLLKIDLFNTDTTINTTTNTSHELIDIRPFIKPEKEILEDTEFINTLRNRIH